MVEKTSILLYQLYQVSLLVHIMNVGNSNEWCKYFAKWYSSEPCSLSQVTVWSPKDNTRSAILVKPEISIF